MKLDQLDLTHFPTPQLTLLIEAVISSAEIAHWPASMEMLKWLNRWIRELESRDLAGSDPDPAAIADSFDARLLRWFVSHQRKPGGPAAGVSRPRTKSPGEIQRQLEELMERGVYRKECLRVSGWKTFSPSLIGKRAGGRTVITTKDKKGTFYKFAPKSDDEPSFDIDPPEQEEETVD